MNVNLKQDDHKAQTHATRQDKSHKTVLLDFFTDHLLFFVIKCTNLIITCESFRPPVVGRDLKKKN
ncbi:hypothetical protein HanRHA438_Chr03g0100411 [Helianthus annuus]|nr:hypothetical protein HanRHA438_Chr03g0100411 [Helianthus annuus]